MEHHLEFDRIDDARGTNMGKFLKQLCHINVIVMNRYNECCATQRTLLVPVSEWANRQVVPYLMLFGRGIGHTDYIVTLRKQEGGDLLPFATRAVDQYGFGQLWWMHRLMGLVHLA